MDPSTTTTRAFALHLIVDDIERSISWYEQVLGATVTRALRLPDRTIATADLNVHGLRVSLAEPVPGTALATPASSGSSVAVYRIAVDDADAAMRRALAAGATLGSEVQDAFWGERTGEVLDPSGHRWAFDQHLRDVSVEEIENHLAEWLRH
jgi:PhnB protein